MKDIEALNLPAFQFKIEQHGDDFFIFDSIRKKNIVLTPEEWVRQNFIEFMCQVHQYPKELMSVEKGLKVLTLQKRSDILVYNRQGVPWLLVECKAPQVKLNEDTIYQALHYHIKLKVKFIIITNGLEHYCLKINETDYEFIENLPQFV